MRQYVHLHMVSITFHIPHSKMVEIFISVKLTIYVLELCLLFFYTIVSHGIFHGEGDWNEVRLINGAIKNLDCCCFHRHYHSTNNLSILTQVDSLPQTQWKQKCIKTVTMAIWLITKKDHNAASYILVLIHTFTPSGSVLRRYPSNWMLKKKPKQTRRLWKHQNMQCASFLL